MFAIGIADSFMVASVGEEAVSAVSLGRFHYDAFDHHHDGTGHRWRSGSRSVPGTEKKKRRPEKQEINCSVRYGAFFDHRCSRVYLSQGASAACFWRCRTAGHGILRYIL